MVRSSDELELRLAVTKRLKEIMPAGRIIHEINCQHGKRRIDVACVTTTQIISVEIKSKKDTLDRLSGQIEAFRSCSHFVVVAAHEKFFDYSDDRKVINECEELKKNSLGCEIWPYPRPCGMRYSWNGAWDINQRMIRLPDTRELLRLLWTPELRSMATRMGMSVKALNRASGNILRDQMWLELTGQEITREVCLHLRARDCPEADPKIKLPTPHRGLRSSFAHEALI